MWFFTSDLHGQGALYEQLLAIGAAHRPQAILIGGDLGPHAAGASGIRRQRVFLQGLFVEFARRLHDASPATRLLVMMGNDDWASNSDCLEQHHGSLWSAMDGRAVEIDGTVVAGSSYVPITPFGIKDWERWEDGGDEQPARLDGWISRNGEAVEHHFDPAARAPTITEALEALPLGPDASAVVLMTHSPPRHTHCDQIGAGQHVGSRAIRAFIERRGPRIVLSGHIHESPRIASFRDRIGDTEVVNPGQFGTSRLCGVWFDPAHPARTLRHTVFA